MGWYDLWLSRNPTSFQLYFFKTHSTLFRIDLGNAGILTHVGTITYLWKGISDNSLVLVRLQPGSEVRGGCWKLNLLKVIRDNDSIKSAITEYLSLNRGSATQSGVWDSLKAYLRGLLMVAIIEPHPGERKYPC